MSIHGNREFESREESRLVSARSPEAIRTIYSDREEARSNLEGHIRDGQTGVRFQPSAVIVNPLFAHDPGPNRNLAHVYSMASAGNGGEKGGAGEAPTHPKLPAEDVIALRRGQATGAASRAVTKYEVQENSNWHTERGEGRDGLYGLLEGEVDMEDDEIVELEPEEDEPPPEALGRWILLGRYIRQKRPDIEDMTVHFNKVWRLRTGINFSPLGRNWFRITLYSEGDHTFVGRGGPWIYRGYPLLVCKIKGEARPSETVLNTVPMWVQVHDLPWNCQKKSTAKTLGDNLGKFLEADLDADGMSPYDFLRMRVEIPIDRRLKPSITAQVKGKSETCNYLFRYERVPFSAFGVVLLAMMIQSVKRNALESLHWSIYEFEVLTSP
ncbi:hypothetical protein ACQ4PT_016955 [Festuca glaucescens]